MKYGIICVLSVLLVSFTLSAQAGDGHSGERVHAIKVGYLTDRLHLSAQQATTFWPVYDAYEGELRDTRQAFHKLARQDNPAHGASDQQSMQYIDDNLDFQEQVLGINRKYKDQFLKIIAPQQLAALYEAERDFKKLLLQQLRQRRGMRQASE